MLGFVIGTICLVALLRLTYARRMWHRAACGYGPAFFGPGWHGPRWRDRWHDRWDDGWDRGWRYGGGPEVMLRRVSAVLDATPAQEKVIRKAADDVTAAVRNARSEIDVTRKDLAQAFSAPSFDAEILGNAFARHDEKLEEVRRAVTGALAEVHDALDEKQRARLVEMLGRSSFHA